MSDQCDVCHSFIEPINGSWVAMGNGDTSDGLSYCPPNPDHDGEFGSHAPCVHEWHAGMMIVSDEDVASVAEVRTVVCGKCDQEY